jgi:hypothetical protein
MKQFQQITVGLTLVIAGVASQWQEPAWAKSSAMTVPPPPPTAMQQPSMIVPSYPKAAKPAAKPRAVADETIVLQSSKPMSITTASKWQQWNDFLTIAAGQEHIPLTLTFENGSSGGYSFEDIRVRLASRPIVNGLTDFRGGSKLNLNLTDKIGTGSSVMIIQGIGPVGAHLSWKLTTLRPSATSVNPTTFSLSDKVVVQGRNFIERTDANKVTIGGKAVTITSASKSQLDLELSSSVPGGKQNLVVTVGTISCSPIQVTVKAVPEVTGVDYVSTAPEQPVVVSGKGFSPNMSENQVFFGEIPATITAGTAESINCIVPEMTFPQWGVPITVKTNGIESTGTVTINIQQRVIENQGVPER